MTQYVDELTLDYVEAAITRLLETIYKISDDPSALAKLAPSLHLQIERLIFDADREDIVSKANMIASGVWPAKIQPGQDNLLYTFKRATKHIRRFADHVRHPEKGPKAYGPASPLDSWHQGMLPR